MSKLFDVETDWVKLDRAIDNLAQNKRLIRPVTRPPYIENATEPEKNHSTPGFDATKHTNVFLVRVGRHDYPLQETEEYDVFVKQEKLSGAWGITRSIAHIKYALSDDDAGAPCSIRMMGVSFAALITMKPVAEFKAIGDFKPFYERLQTEFNGNVQTLSRILAVDTSDNYRNFGTLKGVLFHEFLHFKLAQIDGGFRYKELKKAIHNNSNFANAADACNALRDTVSREWDGWCGWITYKPSYNDHRYVWEEECKYYVRQYQKTLEGQ